jgi:hypothetical protein
MTTGVVVEQTSRKAATVRSKSGVWMGWALVILSSWTSCMAQSQVSAAPAAAPGLTPEEAKTAVQHIVNWLPDKTLARFQRDSLIAISAMFDMLADPNEMQHWPNAVLVLGWVGDENTVPVSRLIEFLERPGPMEQLEPRQSATAEADRSIPNPKVKAPAPYIYPAELEAKRNVLKALARLVQNSPVDPKAQSAPNEVLHYLSGGSSASFWQNKIRWNSAPHYKNDEARNADFAAAAKENYEIARVAGPQKTYARSKAFSPNHFPAPLKTTYQK